MRVRSMRIRNFRGYKSEVTIDFCNLTAFIGKNDVGKSSILEALDIFFNDGKGRIKFDKDDINKSGLLAGDKDTFISVSFDDFPETVVIDATNETTLESEHLLNSCGYLDVIKQYTNTGNPKVYINAYHPNNPGCRDLLSKTDNELRKLLDEKGIPCCDRVKKAVMRAAIWRHYCSELQFEERELDVTKGDTKTIWDKLQNYLPVYTLFQADRKNCDGDTEVQDPLKEAVKEILTDINLRDTLASVAAEVEKKLKEVSSRTLEKLMELNPEVAKSLSPVIPSVESLKWADVFKNVSIWGDEDIPINKRGSGTKRLILLSFFRAEVERRRTELGDVSVIYAIEEPETSQHSENQKIIAKALIDLAQTLNTQIIMSTHCACIVKELEYRNLRLISGKSDCRTVSSVLPQQLPYPSLNEVNYLAFSEISEEYHNELYGFITADDHLSDFKVGKVKRSYVKPLRNGNLCQTECAISEYIRNQIHHPENTHNPRFSREELRDSIVEMREFIQNLQRKNQASYV